jgi:Protein of unknown function (DUF2778)
MTECSFLLNDKPLSELKCGTESFSAFSGLGSHVNRRSSACIQGVGPIPLGSYYIIDRQSGGLLAPLRDFFSGHETWFALYAIDSKIDDETFCDTIKRGNFRLHPKGSLGISKGCITINKPAEFALLRARIKGSTQFTIPGTSMKAYGKVVVR